MNNYLPYFIYHVTLLFLYFLVINTNNTFIYWLSLVKSLHHKHSTLSSCGAMPLNVKAYNTLLWGRLG